MPQYLAHLIVGIVVFQFLAFGGILLLLRGGKPLLRKLLGIFFIVFGLVILDVSAQVSEFYLDHPGYAYWLNALPLLFGPLVYLITKSSLYENYRLSRSDWLHFFPMVLVFTFSVITYQLVPEAVRMEWQDESRKSGTLATLMVGLLILGSIVAYLLLSLRLLWSYRRELRERYSSLEAKNLSWLGRFIYGFAGVITFSILIQVASFGAKNQEWVVSLCMILVFLLLGMIFYNVYHGVQESRLFAGLSPSEDLTKKSANARDTSREGRVTAYLREEQPYLEADLSLAELAERLSMPPRELSETVNAGLAENFFDFINGYRIEHAKGLLTDGTDKKRTVLEVMYASGFNSKSSFNTAFRKYTGMTPSGWKKSQNIVNQ